MLKSLKYLVLIFLSLIFVQNISFATTYKFSAEAVTPFSTLNPSTSMQFKIPEEYQFSDGKILRKGMTMQANVIKIEPAKRGKRDAYILIRITSYTLPGAQAVTLKSTFPQAKVTRYKPFDAKSTAISAGTTVAGLFVDNIAYPINFARGVIEAEEGESRIASGVQTTYEKSMFGYISPGKELEIKAGEKVLITIKNLIQE